MPQIPSRLPREYESPSPDHRTRYTGVVDTVLRYSNVLHLHQRVCHKIGDTMVRTSRCHWSHSASEMGVGRPINTELFGCCPLPSKESALSYSLVRGAPLHAVFSNNLGRAVPFEARSTFRAPLDFSLVQEQMFLVIGIRRLRLCHAEANNVGSIRMR